MPDRPPRLTLRLAGWLVGAEALGLAGAAVFYLVELAVATVDDQTRAAASAGLVLVAAVGVALVARGLLRARRWARAPALVVNLVVLPVALGLFQGGRWYVGGPLLLVGVAMLVLLFHPATTAALGEG